MYSYGQFSKIYLLGTDKYQCSLTNVKGKSICSLNLLPCITHFCNNTFNEMLSDILCSLSRTFHCKYVLDIDFNNDLCECGVTNGTVCDRYIWKEDEAHLFLTNVNNTSANLIMLLK